MPLIRFEVRNEYGLGAKEIYGEANNDDPKALLEGVAVAGLVGILRQLGDLAEFAADVFHDLQEQVMITAARSRKIMARVQHIEVALPPLEKAILAQKSHIHFAYTAGSDWHPNIQNEQNHFIRSDLPRFIMDSYEECRDPPRLHLLDKFDAGGPGTCLRRYSDPSFFKKTLTSLETRSAEKVRREKKALKSKKKGSRRRNGVVSHAVPISRHSGRQIPAAETISTIHMRSKSELGDRSTSFDSRASSSYIECVFGASSSTLHSDQEPNEFSTSRLKMQNSDSILPDEEMRGSFDNLTPVSLEEDHVPNSSSVTWDEKIERGSFDNLTPVSLEEDHVRNSSSVTWDEKIEIVKPKCQQSDNVTEGEGEAMEFLRESSDQDKLESEAASPRNIDPEDIICIDERIPELLSEGNQYDDTGSEPDSYLDALNTLESETETDSECQTKREVGLASAKFRHERTECDPGVMHEMSVQNSETPSVEFQAVSYTSSSRQMTQNFCISDLSGDLVHAQPPQISSMPSNPDISVDTDLCESTHLVDVSRANVFESATDEPSCSGSDFSNSQSPLNDMTVSSLCESHPVKICSGSSINVSTKRSMYESQESVMNDPSSSGSNIPSSQVPLGDKIVSSLCKSQESPVENLGAPSITVWTNGGLLGLEPSKPPDCSVLNVACHKLVAGTKDDTPDISSDTVTPVSHSNVSVMKHDTLDSTPEQVPNNPSSGVGRDRLPGIVSQNDLPPNHDKQDGSMSQMHSVELLSTVLDTRLDNSEDSHHNSSSSNAHGHGLTDAIARTTQDELPFIPDAKGPFSEASQANIESSSSLFGLSQKLLVNGFRRKGLLVHADTSELHVSVKTGLMKLHEPEQKGKSKVVHQISSELTPKENVDNGSPVSSLSSSPPLEHMKISFHPINGYETSKLKLKFPGGHHFHESIKDVMFPSFQLLPEPAVSLQDIDSDSDDNTFCRSSLYMSEELMSQQSESSSEQWEFGESPGSKDHEIYDALRRVSSAESILSTFELEGISHGSMHCNSDLKSTDTENGLKPFHYDPVLGLPSFDSMDPVTSQQEWKRDSDPKDHPDSVSQYPNKSMPLPPPLPPVQWRVMKSHFDVAENEPGAISKAPNQTDGVKDLEATPPQQPEPAPPKQPHMEETTLCLPKTKDQQKLDGHREVNQGANCKEMDERDDLLHQIRTKSFSLRRTLPVRPTPAAPGPTTNIKVAAILEKANAIRQAFVGSDEEGDSENWSDG